MFRNDDFTISTSDRISGLHIITTTSIPRLTKWLFSARDGGLAVGEFARILEQRLGIRKAMVHGVYHSLSNLVETLTWQLCLFSLCHACHLGLEENNLDALWKSSMLFSLRHSPLRFAPPTPGDTGALLWILSMLSLFLLGQTIRLSMIQFYKRYQTFRNKLFTRTHQIDMWQNNDMRKHVHMSANATQTHALPGVEFAEKFVPRLVETMGWRSGGVSGLRCGRQTPGSILGKAFEDKLRLEGTAHDFCWSVDMLEPITEVLISIFYTIIYHEHYYESTLLLIMYIVKFLIVFLKMDIMQWYTIFTVRMFTLLVMNHIS